MRNTKNFRRYELTPIGFSTPKPNQAIDQAQAVGVVISPADSQNSVFTLIPVDIWTDEVQLADFVNAIVRGADV